MKVYRQYRVQGGTMSSEGVPPLWEGVTLRVRDGGIICLKWVFWSD